MSDPKKLLKIENKKFIYKNFIFPHYMDSLHLSQSKNTFCTEFPTIPVCCHSKNLANICLTISFALLHDK